jgi:hypothetical protein
MTRVLVGPFRPARAFAIRSLAGNGPFLATSPRAPRPRPGCPTRRLQRQGDIFPATSPKGAPRWIGRAASSPPPSRPTTAPSGPSCPRDGGRRAGSRCPRVGDRDQRRLHHRLERDPQQLGRLPLMAQVEGGPDAAEPARPGGQHEAPGGRDDRPLPRGLHHHWRPVGPALHARNHIDRYLMDVVGQIADRVEAAGAALPGELRGRFPARGRLAAALAGR